MDICVCLPNTNKFIYDNQRKDEISVYTVLKQNKRQKKINLLTPIFHTRVELNSTINLSSYQSKNPLTNNTIIHTKCFSSYLTIEEAIKDGRMLLDYEKDQFIVLVIECKAKISHFIAINNNNELFFSELFFTSNIIGLNPQESIKMPKQTEYPSLKDRAARIGNSKTLLRKRLNRARCCLITELRDSFKKNTFDFKRKRMFNNNDSMFLQWTNDGESSEGSVSVYITSKIIKHV